jgi:hypothetical protein
MAAKIIAAKIGAAALTGSLLVRVPPVVLISISSAFRVRFRQLG